MPKGIYDRTKSKPRPRRKFFYDKKWLEKRYLQEKKSTKDIAQEVGCCWHSILRWLKEYNIPIRDRYKASNEKRAKLTKEDKMLRVSITKEYLIKNFVNKKKTVNQIAAEFGTSWDTVRRRILRWNLGMRSPDKKGKYKKSTTHYRKFQKKLLRHYGYKCAICGYDKFVNCCHIKRRADTNDNSLENGIVLCPNHHYEFDYGLISIEEIRKYQVNKEKVRHSK